jgi:hypothetical protein
MYSDATSKILTDLNQSSEIDPPTTAPNTPIHESSSSDSSSSSSARTSPSRGRPRRRHSSHFEPGQKYRCLMLKNFDEEDMEEIKDSMLLWIAEIQEHMDSEDELPNADMELEEIPIERVRILLSEDQKRENKTKYREQYAKREDVIQKRKAKESDPKTKEKRDSYQKNPKVQQQKKVRTQVRQGIVRELKKLEPKKYKELESQVLEKVQKRGRTDEDESEQPALKRSKTTVGDIMDIEGVAKVDSSCC